MPGPADQMGPVELDVFAAEGDRVTRGTMKAESFDATRGFAVYTLPGDVQGSRALFRAKDVAAYFTGNSNHRCDASDDAASRWIPLAK